jgi:hypothetical protein
VDALDKELLLKIDQHDYYSPHFIDERKRLDRLTELGFVWREEPPILPTISRFLSRRAID